jgi:RNA polymerase subunit RPABC4/transcription elongation factor Spt4
MSPGRSPSVLTQDEAARVLHAAMARSAWAGLVVGLMLDVSEVARRLRSLSQGVTR